MDTRFKKAPIWDKIVLPNYKPTEDGRFHVRVTTKGMAHVLPYVEDKLVFLVFLASCGLFVSLWSLRQNR